MPENDFVMRVARTEEAKEFPLIKIKKEGDVGYDLYSLINPEIDDYAVEGEVDLLDVSKKRKPYSVIGPQEMMTFRTGIHVAFPMEIWGSLECRSSTNEMKLVSTDAIIDNGFVGELKACLFNAGTEPQIIYHGDRLVQLILRKVIDPRVEEISFEQMPKTERGTSGFGSTGR